MARLAATFRNGGATGLSSQSARVIGRRYHFHAPGIAYAVTTMVLVMGAINGQNNLLFWLFGLGVGGLIVSGILSGGSLLRLEVERETPATAAVGEPVIIRYRVRNGSRWIPAFGLTIEELHAAKRRRYRGTWKTRLTAPLAFVPYIPPGGSVTVEARAGALRRGSAVLGPLQVWTTFPFGLAKKSKLFFQQTQVLIRPMQAPIRRGAIDGLGGLGMLGSELKKNRGGDEFYSLREYSQGDSVRSVAWRSTARLGYAVVREMASRPSRRVWIMVDPAARVTDFERAVSVAAALCAQASDAGLEPGLASPGGSVLESARAGRRHLARLLDRLATFDADDLGNSGSGSALGSAAFAQDGFVLVQAGDGSGTTAPSARRINALDESVCTAPWSPVIETQSPAAEAGGKAASALWRRVFARGDGA